MFANTKSFKLSDSRTRATSVQKGALKQELLRFGSVILIIAISLAIYLLVIRPEQSRWGATDAEVARVIPGDELIANPTFNATRAITINAPPEAIWPWLVQWGYGRAGFYGYDLVENIGSSTGLRSADHIVPELQHLAVGDQVKMSDPYYFCVRAIKPNRLILLAGCSEPSYGTMVWALEPIDSTHTRLIHRKRDQYQLKFDLPLILFCDIADHVAVRKLMLGINDRVQGIVEPLAYQAIELGTYLVIIIECIFAMIAVLRRPQWGSWWGLAMLAALILLIVLYSSIALWGKVLLAACLFADILLLWSRERRVETQTMP